MTLVLGVAASVVANILHALDNPISQAIAAWPPLALLLTVELISRVPVHRRSLAVARLLATATIAGIAAWVSYWHMAGVAARYGETGASAYLLPLSVDGLIIVASICLVELGGQITTLETEARQTAATADAAAGDTPALTARPAGAAPASAAKATTKPAGTARPATKPAGTARPATKPAGAARPATAPAEAAGAGVPGLIPVPTATTRRNPATAAALREVAAALPRPRGGEVATFTPTLTRQGRPAAATAATTGAKKPPAKPRRTPAETLEAAAKIKAATPDITEAALAAKLGITAARWRTIRRQADQKSLGLAA
jgi:hypothetical protein